MPGSNRFLAIEHRPRFLTIHDIVIMFELSDIAMPQSTDTPTPQLSVVAPCYNEELVIDEFYRRTKQACEDQGVSHEIVLINDGSADKTLELSCRLADRDPSVVVVDLSRNHGHQLALSAGLTVCEGERILIIDADLQDPPELLGEMIAKMEAGADVVYGKRRTRSGESRFKLLTASWFYRLIDRLSDTRIPTDTGDFRLISRRALDVLLRMPERHRFIRGMVSWIGFRQVPIEYDRDPRFAGETKYPFAKMLRFAVDAVTSFSTRPLRLAIYFGLASAVIGFGALFYALLAWLLLDTVHGWTSLLAAISLLSAAQLLVQGISGEYLGRLYEESKRRPLFVIRDIIRNPSQDA